MPISPSGATVWRDYVTDGVPASGAHKVYKPHVRAWSQSVEDIVTAAATAALVFDTRANLYAILTAGANTLAWVVSDSTASYNGIYRKSGASGTGSWSRVADLPYSFIVASDAGAGTANAIQATTAIPVSESALVLLNIFEANTASPATVAFNGGSALTIKTNTGNDVAAGGLVAGMLVVGRVAGATFRLINDQVSSAIVAAAEAAQAAAEAAAASATGTAPVLDRSALSALATSKGAALVRGEGGRNGAFAWVASDLSALVAIDTQQARYVAPVSDVSGASGAWVRIGDRLTVDHFGGVSGADSTTALQAAVVFMNATGETVFVPANREYLYSGASHLKITKGSLIGENRYTSVIYRNDGSNKFFQVGDAALPQFSCIGIHLRGLTLRNDNPVTGFVANDSSYAVILENCFVSSIKDMEFYDVTRWLSVGLAANAQCATIDIADCRVRQKLCNLSLSKIASVGGLFFRRIEAFVAGAQWSGLTPSPNQTAGHAFELTPGTGQLVDTVNFDDCQFIFFYASRLIQPSGTGYVVNVWDNSIWDGNKGTAHDITDNGCLVANIHHGPNFWVNAATGYGVRLTITNANSKNFSFTGSHICGAGAEGLYAQGTLGPDREIRFTGGIIDKVNTLNVAGNSAAYIALDGVYLTGVKLGGRIDGTEPLPDYGVTVLAGVSNYTITGCTIVSTVADFSGIKAHSASSKKRIVKDNIGSGTQYGPIPGFSLVSGVDYFNATPLDLEIYIYGGTVSSILKEGAGIGFMTSGLVHLRPGEKIRVTWSAAPTISAYYVP